MKAFRTLSRLAQLLPMCTVIARYIIFDKQIVRFTVLILGVTGIIPIAQSKFLDDGYDPLSCPDVIDPNANCRTSRKGSAFCVITYALFDILHDAIENNVLHKPGST